MRCDWTAVIVSVCGLAAGALAQNQTPSSLPPPRPPAGTAPAPKPVGESDLTIIERTAEGRLKRLEIPAEERAAQVMDLEPAERARVDKVLAERAALLDEILVKNFDLLGKMHAAEQAGNAEESRRVSGLYLAKLDRLLDRGRLEDEIRPELRLDHQAEFTRLITEYRRVLLAEASRESKAEGKEVKPQILADREMRRAMAREFQRSYERAIVGTAVDYDKAMGGLGLKPEQESKVRNIAAEFTQKHKDQATPAQRRDLVMQVLNELDDGQRQKLIKALRGA